MDSRSPRDGKVIEELGYYDPMVPEKDARVILKRERVDYWLGVGAQPTPKTGVLLRKYGTNGSHLEQQKEALERLKTRTAAKSAPAPAATEAAPVAEAASAETATATAEMPAEDSAEGGES